MQANETARRAPGIRNRAEHIYTSQSVWRNPRGFLRAFVADLCNSRELAWQLFLRNTRARYRQSLTGYLWAFVPPLAWTALFLILRSTGQVNGGSKESHISYIVVGLVFWQVFIESAQSPLRVFAEARLMLGKLRFPRESLIVAGLLEVGLQFLVRFPLLLAAWFLMPHTSVHGWWFLPVSLTGLIMTGCCVGILLLPFSLLYQDVAPSLALASGFWLLITPIGYSAPTNGLAGTLAKWNPVATLIESARGSWLGEVGFVTADFTAVSCASGILAIVGWMVARVAFPHMIARFGS